MNDNHTSTLIIMVVLFEAKRRQRDVTLFVQQARMAPVAPQPVDSRVVIC